MHPYIIYLGYTWNLFGQVWAPFGLVWVPIASSEMAWNTDPKCGLPQLRVMLDGWRCMIGAPIASLASLDEDVSAIPRALMGCCITEFFKLDGALVISFFTDVNVCLL
jgi:hypothetical protein